MKRILALATAFSLLVPNLAVAAAGDKNADRPMTRPAVGQQPVGKPPVRPPAGARPPGGGHHRPRPPSTGWHKPRANQWYWRGRWVNRVRGPAFVYPRGYHYRRWYVGSRLPALFLTAQFFYDNVAPLGLEIPPPGYRWVRYGPDLLLVNVRTGSVEQVAYGAFY